VSIAGQLLSDEQRGVAEHAVALAAG
jgi:hypothetical protein